MLPSLVRQRLGTGWADPRTHSTDCLHSFDSDSTWLYLYLGATYVLVARLNRELPPTSFCCSCMCWSQFNTFLSQNSRSGEFAFAFRNHIPHSAFRNHIAKYSKSMICSKYCKYLNLGTPSHKVFSAAISAALSIAGQALDSERMEQQYALAEVERKESRQLPLERIAVLLLLTGGTCKGTAASSPSRCCACHMLAPPI